MNGTLPPGQGEPLNMIISGNSDARVLVDAQPNGGLINFFLYVYETRCRMSLLILGHLDILTNV